MSFVHDFIQYMYNRLFFQLKNENPVLSKIEKSMNKHVPTP